MFVDVDMATHNINGFNFTVSKDGFNTSSAQRDGETAEWNLVDLLRALPREAVAKLHADLLAAQNDVDGTVDYPDFATSLCHQAVAPVTADWHRPDAASLLLSV